MNISIHNNHLLFFLGLTLLCLCSQASPVPFSCEPESGSSPFQTPESEARAKAERSGTVTAEVGALVGKAHTDGADHDLYTITLADEGEPVILLIPGRVKVREGEVVCVGICRGKVEYLGNADECSA